MKILLLGLSVWASWEASIPASVSQATKERKLSPGSGQVRILYEGPLWSNLIPIQTCPMPQDVPMHTLKRQRQLGMWGTVLCRDLGGLQSG